MRRQWEEKSWCAGMVEKTDRTRQLNTKMNLRLTREKKKQKGSEWRPEVAVFSSATNP